MILRLLGAFILVLALSILPLPAALAACRPAWVLLLFIYFQLYMPNYFSLVLLFFMGLSLDILTATVLGEHVFALFLATWAMSTKTRRFKFFALGQQMAFVFLACFIYQIAILLIDAFLGNAYSVVASVGSAAIGMLLWPWIRVFKVKSFMNHPIT